MPLIREYGLIPGRMPPGPRNTLADVPGVAVGHCTVRTPGHNTGVTVILPRADIYFKKCTAAAHVINGYGKTAGLVQVEELGQLETPIALTNTLNVGLVSDALVQYTADACAAHGTELRSVNPVVGECNDSTLNRIAERVVGRAEVYRAIAAAGPDFAQGCVGAGTGMICHGLKGGIGSASRRLTAEELNILGRRPGAAIAARQQAAAKTDDVGSCILVLGTDLPLSSRQLGRVVRRCGVGLARVGSYWGHGSGDIAIGFTTAHALCADAAEVETLPHLREDRLEPAFLAAAEAAEEAVLNALAAAEPTTGYDGTVCHALCEYRDLL